jgi:hypothetical protein
MHKLTKGENMFTIQKSLTDFLEHFLFFGSWFIVAKTDSSFQWSRWLMH